MAKVVLPSRWPGRGANLPDKYVPGLFTQWSMAVALEDVVEFVHLVFGLSCQRYLLVFDPITVRIHDSVISPYLVFSLQRIGINVEGFGKIQVNCV